MSPFISCAARFSLCRCNLNFAASRKRYLRMRGYRCDVAGIHLRAYTLAMHSPLRTITLFRKTSPVGSSLFQAALHTDAAIEEVVEGTRNTVLSWCSALSPEMQKPVARCLDLLALLPAETVQRLSVSVPSMRGTLGAHAYPPTSPEALRSFASA